MWLAVLYQSVKSEVSKCLPAARGADHPQLSLTTVNIAAQFSQMRLETSKKYFSTAVWEQLRVTATREVRACRRARARPRA